MFSNQFLAKILSYFPDFGIKYKNQSAFMKFLGTLLFFFKSFKKDDVNTFGKTVYFPNETFTKVKPLTSKILVLHGLVHMYDENKLSRCLFNFLYLFPQILVLPAMLLLFIVSWKIVIPIIFLLLTPLPAYFRMLYEKRAYLASLYCMGVINTKSNYHIDLAAQSEFLAEQFMGSYYYFMWPFHDVKQDFEEAVKKIEAGQHPYEDKVFDMLDDVLSVF